MSFFDKADSLQSAQGITMFIHLRFQTFLFLLSIFLLNVASGATIAGTIDNSCRDTPLTKTSVDCEKTAGEAVTPVNLEYSYRRAWQLIKDNTMYPERLSNWYLWEHKYDGKLRVDRDLERAINQMLRQLGDQYTYFRGACETQNRSISDDERGVVSYQMLDDSFGYISIRTFASKHVACELQSALDNLSAARSYILDLRDNKGGYVDQALLCFSAMVDRGKFVSIEGRQDGLEYTEDILVESTELVRLVNHGETHERRVMNMTAAKPIIVLVNDGTRSASEMLAGALRDVRQARLIGSKTFGKGVVQGTWHLEPGCSIKIAMARFYLPGGANINGQGIRPDVVADFEADFWTGRPADNVVFTSPADVLTTTKGWPALLDNSRGSHSSCSDTLKYTFVKYVK